MEHEEVFFKEGTDADASQEAIELNLKRMEARMQALSEQIASLNDYMATHSGNLSAEGTFDVPGFDIHDEQALVEKRDALQREYDNLSAQYHSTEADESPSLN